MLAAAAQGNHSPEAIARLKTSFDKDSSLSSGKKNRLAAETGLRPKQVEGWFDHERRRRKKTALQAAKHEVNLALLSGDKERVKKAKEVLDEEEAAQLRGGGCV